MKKENMRIEGLPAILWGKASSKLYIHVHGKKSRKEYAEQFAIIAEEKGYQTLSFDLPEHGERAGSIERCDPFFAIKDLNVISDYAFKNWSSVSLFACSVGAYFSLNAYMDKQFEKCLFQSPIVDMKWLSEHMMAWSGISKEQLKEKQEVATEIDTLRWDYYQYILTHPIKKWDCPTAILYGKKDIMQPITAIQNFTKRFGAKLTISENSEHPFMAKEDEDIVKSG